MATVPYAHIDESTADEPIIAGTRIKVRMIALDWICYGWEAEEIQRHHPDLTLGQVHSALAYYFDHKEEIDQRIADGDELATQIRAEAEESPGRRKLRERGLIPAVRQSLASVDRGEGKPMDDVFDAIENELRRARSGS